METYYIDILDVREKYSHNGLVNLKQVEDVINIYADNKVYESFLETPIYVKRGDEYFNKQITYNVTNSTFSITETPAISEKSLEIYNINLEKASKVFRRTEITDEFIEQLYDIFIKTSFNVSTPVYKNILNSLIQEEQEIKEKSNYINELKKEIEQKEQELTSRTLSYLSLQEYYLNPRK